MELYSVETMLCIHNVDNHCGPLLNPANLIDVIAKNVPLTLQQSLIKVGIQTDLILNYTA